MKLKGLIVSGYDLSINGKKFAGISQRRVRGGVAVQIYLCADKSGSERADLIRRFYQAALKDKQNDKRRLSGNTSGNDGVLK